MPETSGAEGHPALTDQQTGLPNRLHFDLVLKTLFATGRRGLPLSILILEIDGADQWLKNTEGPEAERTLRIVGATMAPTIRESDVLARAGEGRFAVCLIDCNMAGAVLVADRIDGLLDPVRESSSLGFSIGGATFDRDMGEPQDLFEAAEGALRVAQARGRNQMELRR
ncbi:MAG: diguanylate cyclase [Gemmatimonadota bacterium]|jgi:diguanylate cyclase (GGDEF)-like protein